LKVNAAICYRLYLFLKAIKEIYEGAVRPGKLVKIVSDPRKEVLFTNIINDLTQKSRTFAVGNSVNQTLSHVQVVTWSIYAVGCWNKIIFVRPSGFLHKL
jgi:NADPH:quinone reductase-like Zn-dependent oxidoreductase